MSTFEKVIVRLLTGGDFSWRALSLLSSSLKWIFTCPTWYVPPVTLHAISSSNMLAAFFPDVFLVQVIHWGAALQNCSEEQCSESIYPQTAVWLPSILSKCLNTLHEFKAKTVQVMLSWGINAVLFQKHCCIIFLLGWRAFWLMFLFSTIFLKETLFTGQVNDLQIIVLVCLSNCSKILGVDRYCCSFTLTLNFFSGNTFLCVFQMWSL